MGSMLRRSVMLGCLLMATTGKANADWAIIDPDFLAEGSLLTSAFPGVRLTVAGEPNSRVLAAVGFSAENGRNLATTGQLVFAQDTPPPAVPLGWDENNGLLRAAFSVPTNRVRVDIACDDDDTVALTAYTAAGAQLAREERACDGRTTNAVAQLTIERATPDISFVIMGGTGGEAALIDNLQFERRSQSCIVGLDHDSYSTGETVGATLRLINLAPNATGAQVRLYAALAKGPLKKLSPPALLGTLSLAPQSDRQVSVATLFTVLSSTPAGPAEIVCRMLDPTTGLPLDVGSATFLVQ